MIKLLSQAQDLLAQVSCCKVKHMMVFCMLRRMQGAAQAYAGLLLLLAHNALCARLKCGGDGH